MIYTKVFQRFKAIQPRENNIVKVILGCMNMILHSLPLQKKHILFILWISECENTNIHITTENQMLKDWL